MKMKTQAWCKKVKGVLKFADCVAPDSSESCHRFAIMPFAHFKFRNMSLQKLLLAYELVNPTVIIISP